MAGLAYSQERRVTQAAFNALVQYEPNTHYYVEIDANNCDYYVTDNATPPNARFVSRGTDGVDGKMGGTFAYVFDGTSQVMADPGPGKFRLNQAVATTAIQMAIAPDLLGGTDVSANVIARHALSCRVVITSGDKLLEFDSDNIVRMKVDDTPVGPTESILLTSYLLVTVGSGIEAGVSLADGDACEVLFTPNSAEDAATATAGAVAADLAAGAANAAKLAAEAARDDLLAPIDWTQFPVAQFTAPGDRSYRHMTFAELSDIIFTDGAWYRVVNTNPKTLEPVLWGQFSALDILPNEPDILVFDLTNKIVMRRDSAAPANNRYQTILAAQTEGWLIDDNNAVYPDVSHVTGSELPGDPISGYTLFADCPIPSTAVATQTMISFGTGGDSNNFSQLRLLTNGATPNAFCRTAGATAYSGSTTNGTVGIQFKLAARFKQNDFNGYLNGVTLTTGNPDVNGTLPAVLDTLRIGAANTSVTSPYDGDINLLAYVPRALTNGELAALTT